jgi:acyl-CoA synthetase (AMP-forming)/AMP-acid ligase II
VSPTEVEETVFRTGLVTEVAAVGVPDEELGQAIIVVAVPPQGSELDVGRINEECRKLLPRYMIPRMIISRENLPRNPNGKIDRPRILREMLERENRGTR